MRKTLLAAVAAALLLCGCGRSGVSAQPAVTVDPYAGKVQVESGYGTKIWVKEYEELPVNPLRKVTVSETAEIRDENGVVYDTLRGIDVSEHQGLIDWTALSGEQKPDFVIIRAGYRGYGESGKLCIDTYFHENVRGAKENGIPMGIYFFSQATTEKEAEEEAEFLLFLLTKYSPGDFSFPVFFDWEEISNDTARTDHVDGDTMTDCALAFCRRMERSGYSCGIYAYRSLAYFRYDLLRIADYPLWIGALGTCPDYYYGFDIWQHSTAGAFPGIEGNVDVDMIFVPRE